jgi:hypothetical protein
VLAELWERSLKQAQKRPAGNKCSFKQALMTVDHREFERAMDPKPDWMQVGSPVGSPVDLTAIEGGGEAGIHLGVGPSPPQPPPPQPHLGRSAHLSRAVPLVPAEQEQSLGEGSDGNPVYENPELPDNYFEDTYVDHGHAEDVGNGNLGGNNGNGNGQPAAPLDPNSTAHLFRDATWSQSSNTFLPEPLP